MAGYLIAEEGPLAGLILRFEEGDEWVIGRDPDEVELVLEDPMVSRKHVICRRAPEGYILENLSAVNPATQNGKIITEPVLLQEGDIIQVGNTFFRFSERAPESDQGSPLFLEEASDLATLSMATPPDARWMIKVITGPNSGAEFFMQKGRSYIIGKDPEVCDIIFQDLSVSRQHAKITLDDEAQVTIEDLEAATALSSKANRSPRPHRFTLKTLSHWEQPLSWSSTASSQDKPLLLKRPCSSPKKKSLLKQLLPKIGAR